jgi:hypothetical protein
MIESDAQHLSERTSVHSKRLSVFRAMSNMRQKLIHRSSRLSADNSQQSAEDSKQPTDDLQELTNISKDPHYRSLHDDLQRFFRTVSQIIGADYCFMTSKETSGSV